MPSFSGHGQEVWPAPAKINLFLHVVGRRSDGYHLLQTVFRLLDFGDELSFTLRRDGRIHLIDALPGIAVQDNLIWRAARVLQQHVAAAEHCGVDIRLTKRIPVGGGLGGGSSNAATTLIALNHLWECQLSRAQLAALGLTLGADVPVFIHGRSTFASGIGEIFSEVNLSPAWYLLTTPDVNVPTAEIFSDARLSRNTAAITPAMWHSGFGGNDLEAVAVRRYPQIATQLQALRQIAPNARMSGSGATCFAEFADVAAAQAALQQCPAKLRARVVRAVDVHPLAEKDV